MTYSSQSNDVVLNLTERLTFHHLPISFPSRLTRHAVQTTQGKLGGLSPAPIHFPMHDRTKCHRGYGLAHRRQYLPPFSRSPDPRSFQRSLMCQFDYLRHGGDDMPSGEYCRRPRVGALTASVMTGLAVMDGIVCKWIMVRCYLVSHSSFSLDLICPAPGR